MSRLPPQIRAITRVARLARARTLGTRVAAVRGMHERSMVAMLLMMTMSACGSVESATPPDAAPPGDAPAADATPDALAVVDRSCIEVKARLGIATDGVHWIDPDLDAPSLAPFQVYCARMDTPAPREYLELALTSHPADAPTVNYATHAMGAVHGQWTCDCGPATMVFSKLRIDPTTLVVDNDDLTFAVYTQATNVGCLNTKPGCPGGSSYGVAASCVTNFDASGRANIDLTGVPFHVATTNAFRHDGFTPAGGATIDRARKVVELTGGGDCGGYGGYDHITLAQDGSP